MYKRNSGLEDREILQNQFTAYVKRAVHNRRIRFLQDESRSSQTETSLTDKRRSLPFHLQSSDYSYYKSRCTEINDAINAVYSFRYHDSVNQESF